MYFCYYLLLLLLSISVKDMGNAHKRLGLDVYIMSTRFPGIQTYIATFKNNYYSIYTYVQHTCIFMFWFISVVCLQCAVLFGVLANHIYPV